MMSILSGCQLPWENFYIWWFHVSCCGVNIIKMSLTLRELIYLVTSLIIMSILSGWAHNDSSGSGTFLSSSRTLPRGCWDEQPGLVLPARRFRWANWQQIHWDCLHVQHHSSPCLHCRFYREISIVKRVGSLRGLFCCCWCCFWFVHIWFHSRCVFFTNRRKVYSATYCGTPVHLRQWWKTYRTYFASYKSSRS